MDVGPTLILRDRPSPTAVGIYILSDPSTGDVRYIGKANDPEQRLRQHLGQGQLNRYRSRKNSWLKGLLDRGLRPELKLITWLAAEDADRGEQVWIQIHRNMGARLTNGTNGGDGGAVTDPEARARIRAAHLGATRSPATRARMSISAKRRCASEKERDRLRSISNGKPPVSMGEKNPRARLSDQQVKELRERAAAGEVLKALAAVYGITPASVTQLVLGQYRRAAGGPIRESKQRRVLTDDDLAEIRRLYGDGVGLSDLARGFGVHRSRITSIVIVSGDA